MNEQLDPRESWRELSESEQAEWFDWLEPDKPPADSKLTECHECGEILNEVGEELSKCGNGWVTHHCPARE